MFEQIDREYILRNDEKIASIKIIGVGGGGSNAVNKMKEDKIHGIEFIVSNTDKQALKDSKVSKKIILGETLTKGLGAGANPEIGQKAAIESIDQIKEALKGSDLVFVAAGMGGGTGTGAAPIIAKTAKEEGALVIAIITTPFSFEGNIRGHNATEGLEALAKEVDSVIIISNNRLLHELGGIPLTDSFQYADAILKQAVRTITDLITKHSLINLDFADVKAVLKDKGTALIGTGKAQGENAAVEAAIQAINSPILESSIEGADHAIVNVLGGPKVLTINQAQQAVQTIKEASTTSDIDVIFGVTIDENMGDEIVVSVIATGITSVKDDQLLTGSSTADYAKALFDNEVDIEKYRSGFTQEVPINPSIIKNAESNSPEPEEDDILASLKMLDDDDDITSIEEMLQKD